MTRIVTKLTVTIGIYFARSTTIRMTSPSPRNPLLTGTPLATRLMRGPAPPRCLHLAPTWQAHMAPSTPAAHLTGSACMMLCAPLRLSTLRPVANDLLNGALRLDNELSVLAATCSLRSVSKVQINHWGLQNPL